MGSLLANDPDVVLGTLAEAFEDNEAAAAPVGVLGDEASVVVVVPPVSAVPQRHPTITPAGNRSLKKLTKTEIAGFYTLLVCGYALATVREAFAVAPSLTHFRIVAIRGADQDACGKPRVEAVLAARARRALDVGAWETAGADVVVNDTSDHLHARFRGATNEPVALQLDTEPDIAALVRAVDYDELAG